MTRACELVVLLALALLLLDQTRAAVATDDVVDQGDRVLVIVSTKGATRDYTLNVREETEKSGDLVLVFSFSADGITYGDGGNDEPVDATVTFAGLRDAADVTCGKDEAPLPQKAYGTLPKGARDALTLDDLGGLASATSFGDTRGEPSAQLKHTTFPTYTTALWLLDADDEPTDEREDDFAETCTVRADSVMRSPSQASPLVAEATTFLVPQVDFTSSAAKTDHQRSLAVDVAVARTHGTELQEGYPVPAVSDWGWSYDMKTTWLKEMGDESNIGFTDQPVWIFADRSSADRMALWLGLLGVGWGVVGAELFVLVRALPGAVVAAVASMVSGPPADGPSS